MDRYHVSEEKCDACGKHGRCAYVEHLGCVVLVLCADCLPPFAEQEKKDQQAWAASREAARHWAEAPMPRAW